MIAEPANQLIPVLQLVISKYLIKKNRVPT